MSSRKPWLQVGERLYFNDACLYDDEYAGAYGVCIVTIRNWRIRWYWTALARQPPHPRRDEMVAAGEHGQRMLRGM